MRIPRGLLTICLLLASHQLPASPGWLSLGNVTAVGVLPQGVELVAGTARVRVVALSSNVVRVRYAPQGTFPADDSFAVLPNAFPQPPNIRLEQTADAVTFSTGAVPGKDSEDSTAHHLSGHEQRCDQPGPAWLRRRLQRKRLSSLEVDARGRTLFRFGRQNWPARSSQSGVYPVEYGCFWLAGIDRSSL